MFERTRPVKQWGHYFVVQDDEVSAEHQPIDPRALRRVMADRRAASLGVLTLQPRLTSVEATPVLEPVRTIVSSPRPVLATLATPTTEPTRQTSLQPTYTTPVPPPPTMVAAPAPSLQPAYTTPMTLSPTRVLAPTASPLTVKATTAYVSPATISPQTPSPTRVPTSSSYLSTAPAPTPSPYYAPGPAPAPTRIPSSSYSTQPAPMFYPTVEPAPKPEPYTPASPIYAERASLSPPIDLSSPGGRDIVQTSPDEGEEMIQVPLFEGSSAHQFEDNVSMELAPDQTPVSSSKGWIIAAGVAAVILAGLYAHQEGWV